MTFMNDKKHSSRLLMAVLLTAYAAIYVGRKNFSVCMAGMIADGVIDKTVAGTAGTAFLAVYACGQFLNGYLGDRISPKLMISTGLAGAGIANILMGLSVYSFTVPLIWGLCGLFCSMLWSPVVRCMSEWIPKERQSASSVYISITLPVGSLVSYSVCSVMMHFFSWREAFFACSIVLFAACAVFLAGFSAIRDYIKDTDSVNRVCRETVLGNMEVEMGIQKNKISVPILIIRTGLLWAVFGILFNGILKDGLDLWVPTCITEFFGMSVSVSSLLTGILPVVNLVGVFAARYLNDRFFRNEMTTAAVLFGFSMISFIPLLLIIRLIDISGNIFIAILAVLLISVVSSSMLGVNTMILTFIPFRFSIIGRSSGVTGFLNFCSYIAASLSGITVGFISSNFGWSAAVTSFALCAAAGTAACAAGIRDWKKSSARLSGEKDAK